MRLQDLSNEQLSQYADKAIAHGKTNHALNALNQLVRRQPDQAIFLKLADLYQQLKRPAIEALYLQAALQKVSTSPRKTLEARRDGCLERFLESNPKVVQAQANLAKAP